MHPKDFEFTPRLDVISEFPCVLRRYLRPQRAAMNEKAEGCIRRDSSCAVGSRVEGGE